MDRFWIQTLVYIILVVVEISVYRQKKYFERMIAALIASLGSLKGVAGSGFWFARVFRVATPSRRFVVIERDGPIFPVKKLGNCLIASDCIWHRDDF